MRMNKLYIVIGFILAFGLLFELAAHADEANEETTITFSAPVQIPGQVLPAGTYRFELAAPNDNLELVRILNADGTKVYATVQTVPAERRNASGDTIVTLAAPESGKPDFLVKWFYPGNTIGLEFVYSKQQEQQIAHSARTTFVGNRGGADSFAAGN